MILRDVITVLAPTDVTDGWGHVSQSWASPTETVEPAQVWPIPPTEDALNTANRSGFRWRAVLTPISSLRPTDRARWDGLVYEVDGAVEVFKRGAVVHHIEVVLAEVRMVDECTISSTTPGVFNATTGDYPLPTLSTITSACYVRRDTTAEQQVEAGDRAVALRRYIVSVPITVLGVIPGNIVKITASKDPDLLNAVLVVRDVAQGTSVTARQLGCEVGT